jgi:mRNA-degrading endonuclease RelE of RelBE toxin-antitoxin system
VNWKVVVLPEFYFDLEEAGVWYEQKLQGLGTRFAGEVLDVWADLAVNPLLSCKKDPRRNIRWRYPARFPYKVVYSVEEETRTVVVIALIHAARHERVLGKRIQGS